MREYLATRLMSAGRELPASTRWWPLHSKNLSKFILIREANQKSSKRVKDDLFNGAHEWDEFFLSLAPGPMTDHVKLEVDLVEAAIRTDLVKIKETGELLARNIDEIAEAAIGKKPEIPGDRLRSLLADHVSGFIESVIRYMDDDEKAFRVCEKRRGDNTLALAMLTAEWS